MRRAISALCTRGDAAREAQAALAARSSSSTAWRPWLRPTPSAGCRPSRRSRWPRAGATEVQLRGGRRRRAEMRPARRGRGRGPGRARRPGPGCPGRLEGLEELGVDLAHLGQQVEVGATAIDAPRQQQERHRAEHYGAGGDAERSRLSELIYGLGRRQGKTLAPFSARAPGSGSSCRTTWSSQARSRCDQLSVPPRVMAK